MELALQAAQAAVFSLGFVNAATARWLRRCITPSCEYEPTDPRELWRPELPARYVGHVAAAPRELVLADGRGCLSSRGPSTACCSCGAPSTSSDDTVPDCWDELEPEPELCVPGLAAPEGFVPATLASDTARCPWASTPSAEEAASTSGRLPHSHLDPDGFIWRHGLQVFEVLDEQPLGKGTFGEVFRVCVPLPSGHRMPAVLKLLLPDTRYLDFAAEVESLKCMWGASGSVQLLAACPDLRYKGATRPALLLDLCDEGTLEDLMDARLRQQGGACSKALLFDEPTLRLLMRQLLGSLAQVHAANMIHLDIKPANLLIKRGQIKIADFGCAVTRSRISGRFETEGAGTMLFMAKEVRDARLGVVSEDGINEKADVFSAGCVLAQMAFLHGKSSAHYAFTRHMNVRPTPGFVPPALVAYLRLLTDPDPRRRPSVAEALQHEWMQG